VHEKAGIMKLRSLFVAIAGAFLIVDALAPKADAELVAYFNFEDTTLGAPIVTTDSQQPPATQPSTLTVTAPGTTMPTSVAGLTGMNSNIAPGDPDANLHALGFTFTPTVAPSANLTFSVSTLGLTNLSLSFAINNNGNGFTTATFQYRIGGAGPFITDGSVTLPPPPGGTQIVVFNYSAAVNNQASVDFRISLTGGASQGTNLQTVIDNIQLNAIPEPATTLGGLFGVLGLCWHQRRRLIRCVRLRRA
jgi:hypothetical protein